jgi:hypothetical protein
MWMVEGRHVYRQCHRNFSVGAIYIVQNSSTGQESVDFFLSSRYFLTIFFTFFNGVFTTRLILPFRLSKTITPGSEPCSHLRPVPVPAAGLLLLARWHQERHLCHDNLQHLLAAILGTTVQFCFLLPDGTRNSIFVIITSSACLRQYLLTCLLVV